MSRGPMGDPALLGGVDTSPLYGYYKGVEGVSGGIRNFADAFDKFSKAKAEDATAAAIVLY